MYVCVCVCVCVCECIVVGWPWACRCVCVYVRVHIGIQRIRMFAPRYIQRVRRKIRVSWSLDGVRERYRGQPEDNEEVGGDRRKGRDAEDGDLEEIRLSEETQTGQKEGVSRLLDTDTEIGCEQYKRAEKRELEIDGHKDRQSSLFFS